MADDDIKISVEIDTGDSARDLGKVRDASEDAGRALDSLETKAKNTDATVVVDIDIDEAAARRASDALEDVDRKGRGMGDGVGFGNNALRDLTGPLGDSVGPAGDLGDAFEGLGDIVGGVAGKLGLGAEAVGKLSGAIAGIGVVVAAGVAAWSLYRKSQEDAEEASRKLYEIQEKLADGKIEEAAAGLAEQYEGTIRALRDLGYESGQIVGVLRGQDQIVGELERKIGLLETAYDEANLAAAEGVPGEQDRALALRDQLDALVLLQGNLENAQGAWAANEEGIAATREVTDGLVTALGGVKDEAKDAAEQVSGIEAAFDSLTKALDEADAIESVRDAFDDIEDAALAAWTAAAENAPDADRAMRDYEQSVRNALREVGLLDEQIEGLAPETIAKIFTEVQQGDLDEARRLLEGIEANIDPIKLQIDLADLDKKAAVAAARARAITGGSRNSPGPGDVGYMKGEGRVTVNNYSAPPPSPLQVSQAQRTFTRVQG